MKSSRFDIRSTCDTDDSEQLELRQTQYMVTQVLRPGLVPSFKSVESATKIRKIQETDFSSKVLTTENFDSAFEEIPEKDPLNHLLEEVEEEFSHNWLPNPCFIHPYCMDFPTPKRAFSPNKPKYLKFTN